MLQLVGINLGERHKCLNNEINSAVERRAGIGEQGLTDAEVLLNIGIASKNTDIDFILDVFKSGNELYISKALKSVFLYKVEHSDLINPENLAANIFPYVSLKMKRKILNAISTHLQDERAELFFDYCMINHLVNNATKFFIFTTESFKLKFINNEIEYSNKKEFWTSLFPVKRASRRDVLKFVCGNSFELAETFLKNNDKAYGDKMLHDFRYLYFVSDVKYLDLLEKYAQLDSSLKIGLRISKDITIKHKDRILKQPHLYALKLRSEMLMKHSSPEEVKIYAAAVLPDSPEEYWSGIQSLHCFYNVFPVKERFDIIKDIFVKKYPDQEFEESNQFVETGIFRVMSTEKIQAWALNKIIIEKDRPEDCKNFEWYKYLSIDTALEIVKEELPKIQNCFKRREILLNVVESCATPEDIEKLLQYYFQNHKNDFVVDREYFLNKVIEYHKIFQYEDNVWTILLNLLLDDDLLSLKTVPQCSFATIITLYHMLHKKALPLSFEGQYNHWHTWEIYIDRLNEEQKKVFKDLLQIHINKLLLLETKTYDKNVQKEAYESISFVLQLFRYYKKTKADIPEIVLKFAKLDWDEYCDNEMFLYCEADFNQKLKKHIDLVKPSDDLIESVIKHSKPRFNLKKFLRNLKIYFLHDEITKEFMKFFKECIVERPNYSSEVTNSVVHFAVLGLILLGTPAEIKNFMLEYAPTEPRTSAADSISVIRKAVSRLAYHAPTESSTLSTLMTYVRGGYLHYCLKTLPSHVARLPLPSCLQLLNELLKCFEEKTSRIVLRPLFYKLNEADMKVLVTKLWDHLRSPSHRHAVYIAVLYYLRRKDVNKQIKLFNDLLKPLNLRAEIDYQLIEDTVCPDEGKEVIVPKPLRGLHIITSWQAVMSSEDTPLKNLVLRQMAENISIVKQEFVEEVLEDFVKHLAELRGKEKKLAELAEKWQLLASYLIYYTATVEDVNKGILLISSIINMFNLESFDDEHQMLCFLQYLMSANSTIKRQKHSQANQILDHIADLLKSIQSHHYLASVKLATVANILMDSYYSQLRDEECNVETVCRELQQVLATEVSTIVEAVLAKMRYKKYKKEYNSDLVEMLEGILLQISDTVYDKTRQTRWFDLVLFFCKGLVNCEKKVTHMLALRLLPRYSIEKRREEYEELLEKIETFEDIEVRTLLNKNFSGSKRRRLETAPAV